MGDLHTVALAGTDGTIDWYCCPSLRLAERLRLDPRQGEGRLLPHRARWQRTGHRSSSTSPTRTSSSRASSPRRAWGRSRASCRSRSRRRTSIATGSIRRVEGVRGEMRFRVEMQPRFNYGRDKHEIEQYEHGVRVPLAEPLPRAPGDDAGGAATRPASTVSSPCGRDRRSRSSSSGSSPTTCRASTRRPRRAPRTSRRSRSGASWLSRSQIQGPLARDGQPLGAHPEAPDLPPDRRDRGRAHDEPPRADRRRPQLGLPLHVDPGRGVLALRVASAGVHRRGGGVHGLARATGSSRSTDAVVGPAPDHVRRSTGGAS